MIGEWRLREDRPVIQTPYWKDFFIAEYEILQAGGRLVLRSQLDNHEARWGEVRYALSKKSCYGTDSLAGQSHLKFA